MHSSERHAPDEARAWALLLALARCARERRPIGRDVALCLREDGALEENGSDPWLVARPSSDRGWSPPEGILLPPEVELLFDLYMPLCVGEGRGELTIAHLGQTLDGRIALHSGKSQFITGTENLVHTHRLRALFDAVLVGRRTVHSDDPQLTTRLCPGPNPVRVVVDPERRLGEDYRVFQDGSSATLLVCKADAARAARHHGQATVVPIEPVGGELPVQAVLAALHERGLRRVFIEGGGLTVSRFLDARALTRLQITVAPTIFGSGRAALTLPEIQELSQARALKWRHFSIGPDVLFDCTVRS
jgi:diaminohydroxyphosphoribosylaminopyrimidine deaminase/5-amino-6-(5-phosphoribosylamino)uracil reductase